MEQSGRINGKMAAPRFMIAAPKSGSGKTMITCGLLRALLLRGKKTAAFKCGPDYIDPQFHETVVGAPSRNLDPFFTDGPMTRYLFGCHARSADVSVIEGVMGYYDGLGGTSVEASAYHLAQMTETPVVLVMDARGMSLSVLAELKGFLEFRMDSRIRGVIFNRMSRGIYQLLAPMVQEELGIRPLGYVPESEECRLESRHLGLVLPGEVENLTGRLDRLAEILEETVDLDGLLELAGTAPELSAEMPAELRQTLDSREAEEIRRAAPVIGVARDEAFQFIYADNLRLLEELGAKIVFFSPLHDSHLQEGLQGVLLYGGYPELYAEKLSANDSMRKELKTALEAGMPCMAECGGYMYLSQQMEDMDQKTWPMVGAVPGEIYRTKKLGRFGYIRLETGQDQVLGGGCGPLRGHEFHYFDSTDCGTVFHAQKPNRKRGWECMHGSRTMLAGFPHLYYYACPGLALEYLKKCCEFGGTKSCG